MIVAPPIVQLVQTALAQVLFAPPSLSANSRDPSASVARTATVMAVPSAIAKAAPNSCPKDPLRDRKNKHEYRPGAGPDADREHDGHDFSPGKGASELPATPRDKTLHKKACEYWRHTVSAIDEKRKAGAGEGSGFEISAATLWGHNRRPLNLQLGRRAGKEGIRHALQVN